MSKTFKCVEHEEEVLEVYPFTGEEGGRKFSLLMPHVSSNAGIAFDSTTAPALALAILEAAGVEPVNHSVTGLGKTNWLEGIAHSLKLHIEHGAKATAEAEAQAKLEAEALEFFNEFRVAAQLEPIDSWAEAHPLAQEQWLAVARKAREMRAEK